MGSTAAVQSPVSAQVMVISGYIPSTAPFCTCNKHISYFIDGFLLISVVLRASVKIMYFWFILFYHLSL